MQCIAIECGLHLETSVALLFLFVFVTHPEPCNLVVPTTLTGLGNCLESLLEKSVKPSFREAFAGCVRPCTKTAMAFSYD